MQILLQADRGVLAPSASVQNVDCLHMRVSTHQQQQPIGTSRALRPQVGDPVGCLQEKGVGSAAGLAAPGFDPGRGEGNEKMGLLLAGQAGEHTGLGYSSKSCLGYNPEHFLVFLGLLFELEVSDILVI